MRACERLLARAQARVVGLEAAGYLPSSLQLFVGTYNCSDGKPPADLAQLTRFIPPRKVHPAASRLHRPAPSRRWLCLFCVFVTYSPVDHGDTVGR